MLVKPLVFSFSMFKKCFLNGSDYMPDFLRRPRFRFGDVGLAETSPKNNLEQQWNYPYKATPFKTKRKATEPHIGESRGLLRCRRKRLSDLFHKGDIFQSGKSLDQILVALLLLLIVCQRDRIDTKTGT